MVAIVSQEEIDREAYGVAIGDAVEHIKDPGCLGVVRRLDRNLQDITTCGVVWDDDPSGEVDTQWTNKLRRVS